MPKFKVGDRVRKVKGYRYEGIVIGVSKTTYGDTRYDVQVDTHPALAKLDEMADAYSFTDEMKEELGRYIGNCHGMIHIFSEEQLEIDPIWTK